MSTGGTPATGPFTAAPAGLVMIGLDGPALVCADGVCATPDGEAGAGADR